MGPREHHPTLTIEVGHDIVVSFRRAAAARDVPIRSLINSLLDTIATDHLIDAVLDDRDLAS